MKVGFAFTAAAVALDADYTDNLSTNGAVLSSHHGFNKCFSCEVTGADTTSTFAACTSQGITRGLEFCTPSTNPHVCFLSVVKNGNGEVIGIRTGCSEPNVSLP